MGGALAQEAALAGVGPLGVLADDREVRALGDRPGHPVEGAQVDVEVELEAELEQQPALEGARRDGRVADGRADGAEEDGVEAAELLQRLVGEDRRRRAGSGRPRGRSRSCRGPRPAAATTLSASAQTSGPMPSPPMTATRCLLPGAHVPLVLFVDGPAASRLRCRHGDARREIEKPPTQWTVRRRARERARLVNNAYEVLGAAHGHSSLSQPGRLVNHGCRGDRRTARGRLALGSPARCAQCPAPPARSAFRRTCRDQRFRQPDRDDQADPGHLRPPGGRARGPDHPRPGRDRPGHRVRPGAGRPERERRLPRRQGRPGEDGVADPPAAGDAQGRSRSSTRPAPTTAPSPWAAS